MYFWASARRLRKFREKIKKWINEELFIISRHDINRVSGRDKSHRKECYLISINHWGHWESGKLQKKFVFQEIRKNANGLQFRVVTVESKWLDTHNNGMLHPVRNEECSGTQRSCEKSTKKVKRWYKSGYSGKQSFINVSPGLSPRGVLIKLGNVHEGNKWRKTLNDVPTSGADSCILQSLGKLYSIFSRITKVDMFIFHRFRIK